MNELDTTAMDDDVVANMKRLAERDGKLRRRRLFRALTKFCTEIDTLPPMQRTAMVRYLAAKYGVTELWP